jgi:protein involved in polysaccharide export with SLBB domain
LTVSGGPSEFGSFRSIKLIRNDEVVEEVDLYDTFIFGRSSFDTRLKTGDIIFIEPVLNLVSVIGGVARPATYELKTDETLNVAIAFANNLTVEADKNDINLVRVNDGKINSIKMKDVSDLNNIASADMDRLIIKKYSLRSVDIFGAVNNPGNYIMNEGEGIKDLIERAGGYTENAYPFGGVLENIRAREINELANEEIYNTFLDELSLMYASGSAGGSEIGSLAVIMDELKEMSVTGRVNAEFDLDVLTKNPERDVLLQDGDVVTIPEFLNQVYVFGEIPNQGSLRYMQGLEINDYIEMKGGYESRADKKSVFVLQPNGETYRVSKNRFINNREIEIFPGSIIFVPRKVNASMLFTQAAQAYVSILGNLGVSLASLSVLKD